jgi:hypothetical protein
MRNSCSGESRIAFGVVWDHLRMEPQDDPEARIRALEQPLADYARATELGTTPYTAPNDAYLPPPLPPRKSSGGIPWVIFGVAAVVFMIIAAGVGFIVVNNASRQIPDFPGVSVPSMPSGPTAAPPGEQLSVAGVGETKTIECNDNIVSISGVSNTVTITGHCTTVTVSGMQNKITVDTSDQINASGFDNVVTYHSGDPDINNAGNNVVQQG